MHSHALRDRLLVASTDEVPAVVADMSSYRRWIDPLLRDASAHAEAEGDAKAQLNVSLALLPADATQVDYLSERLLNAAPDEASVLRDALAPQGERALPVLIELIDEELPPNGTDGRRKTG